MSNVFQDRRLDDGDGETHNEAGLRSDKNERLESATVEGRRSTGSVKGNHRLWSTVEVRQKERNDESVGC